MAYEGPPADSVPISEWTESALHTGSLSGR